jgi:hypothetical protein
MVGARSLPGPARLRPGESEAADVPPSVGVCKSSAEEHVIDEDLDYEVISVTGEGDSGGILACLSVA